MRNLPLDFPHEIKDIIKNKLTNHKVTLFHTNLLKQHLSGCKNQAMPFLPNLILKDALKII